MSTPSHIEPEALLAHSDWIRRLVAGLVYDPSRADDVLQETWLMAMQRPPGEDLDLRAWLATVARRVASNGGRRSARRRKREQLAARLEALPSTVEVIDRARLQGRMVEAVLALDEPYRTSVLLRFFEELPPREIAQRVGRPVNTVRSHVQRGLAQLRADLDSEYGDRETWGIALLPFALSGTRLPVSSLLPAQAAAVALWTKWAFAAALLLVIGLGARVLLASPTGPIDVADSVSAAAEAAAPLADLEPSGIASTPGASLQRTEISLTSPPGGVEVVLRDEATGRPASNVPWWVLRTGAFDLGGTDKPEEIPTPLYSGVTSDQGIAFFPLPEDAVVHFVTARTAEHARGSWPLRVADAAQSKGASEPASPIRLLLSLTGGGTVRGRALDLDGRPLPGLSITRQTFFHEEEVVGETGDDGFFLLDRMANLPRRFLLSQSGLLAPALVDPECLRFDSVSDVDKTFLDRTRETDALFLEGAADDLNLGDVTVWTRWVQTGQVVDGQGNAVPGARITNLTMDPSGKPYSNLWRPCTWLGTGAEVTDAEGQFQILFPIAYEAGASWEIRANGANSMGPTINVPRSGGGLAPIVLTLDSAVDQTFELRLVDRERPDGMLWHFHPEKPMLKVNPLFPDYEWGGRGCSFQIPSNGSVQLTTAVIGIGGGPILLQVEGYAPYTLELDFTQEGQTVELLRDPTVEVTVVAEGPGAARAELVDIMVSALPPVEPWESWALLGPAGTRPIGRMDCGLLDYCAWGAALDEPVTMPRPNAREVWVYVQLQTPSGYQEAVAFPFGPFREEVKSIRCEVDAAAWVVTGATGEEGDAAGLEDRRQCEVKLRVISLATGEPIEGAEFMLWQMGKHRGLGSSSSEDGTLVGHIQGDEDDARIRHPMFAELRLEPLVSKPGGSIDLGDIGLEPLRAIAGQLVDRRGHPLAEKRSLRWTDADGNDRWTRAKEDGTFVLAVKDEAPLQVRIMGSSGVPMQVGTLVDLLPPSADTGEGKPRPLLCEVPPEIDIRIEIEGIPTALAIQSAPIHLETSYGVIKRTWPLGAHEGRALFERRLPPGTYTLTGGVLLQFPPYEFVVPDKPDSESMTLRIPGRSALE